MGILSFCECGLSKMAEKEEEEEETEATASQFTSLNVVDDKFSELPEHIIHHILGFLRSIKDIVRTSAISKSYHQAFGTFPIPVFDSWDFVSGGKDIEGKTEQNFIRFVDSYLQRFRRQNGGMKIFNLRIYNINVSDHTTRWVGMALDNKVEHLALQIDWNGTPISCLIPGSVFSATWLKSLLLAGLDTIYSPLNEINRVDLPSLTSFRVAFSNLSDKQLQKLLSGCPVLQCIALWNCESLTEVDIFNQPNLEALEILGSYHLTVVRIRAPKLKSFSYNCYDPWVSSNDVVVEIHNSPELKSLRISSDVINECFHKFIAKFPLLEDLSIEFPTRPVTYKSLFLNIDVRDTDADGDMKGEDVHKRLPPAACNIEKLRLEVSAPLSWHSHILNGLLSACHPTTIVLGDLSEKHFIKLVCEELGNRENNSKCWCKDDFKCWKHQLKEVKIQKITCLQEAKEDLDWDALFDLLPTLEFGNNIYFKLMW